MRGGVHDVITGNKFNQNRSRGFRATGVQKSGTPIDLACRPYNTVQHYRADCDLSSPPTAASQLAVGAESTI